MARNILIITFILIITLSLLCLNDRIYRKCFLISIFLYPLFPSSSGFKIYQGIPLLTFQKIILGILLLSWIIRKKESKFFIYLVKNNSTIRNITLLVTFFVISIISNHSKEDIVQLFNYLTTWFIFLIIISTTLVYHSLYYKSYILKDKYMNLVLLSAFIIAFFGIIYSLTGINVFIDFLPYPENIRIGSMQTRFGILRASSSFTFALPLAIYLVLMCPLGFILHRYKTIYIMTLLLCIILTFSRGALISIFFVFLFLFIKKKSFIGKNISTVFIIFLAFIFFLPYIKEMVYSVFFPALSHSKMVLVTFSRLISIKAAIASIFQVPILGFGLASFTKLLGAGLDSPMHALIYPHLGFVQTDYPYYLSLYFGIGVIGLTIFAAFVISTFRNLMVWPIYIGSGGAQKKRVNSYFLLSFFGFLLANSFTTHHTPWPMLFMIVGYVVSNETVYRINLRLKEGKLQRC